MPSTAGGKPAPAGAAAIAAPSLSTATIHAIVTAWRRCPALPLLLELRAAGRLAHCGTRCPF